jgi:hypothetical protein
MKIYFGNASEDMFADGTFECSSNQFYYGLEYGTNTGGMDEVHIFDGCNRYLPVHIEAIPELIAALQEIQNVQEKIFLATRATELAESETEGYVTKSWNDEFEVDFDTVE